MSDRLTAGERAIAVQHIERIKTTEEIFAAGWQAGQEALCQPMGPCRTFPTRLSEAYDQFLEEVLNAKGWRR